MASWDDCRECHISYPDDYGSDGCPMCMLKMAEAEAMALVLSHEGRIEKQADTIERLEEWKRLELDQNAHYQDTIEELRTRVAELEKENFALAAGQCPDLIGTDGGHQECGERVNVEELNAVTRERDRLRSYAEAMAEHECEYGDGCPLFPKVALNHGRCTGCLAREALESLQVPAVTWEGSE